MPLASSIIESPGPTRRTSIPGLQALVAGPAGDSMIELANGIGPSASTVSTRSTGRLARRSSLPERSGCCPPPRFAAEVPPRGPRSEWTGEHGRCQRHGGVPVQRPATAACLRCPGLRFDSERSTQRHHLPLDLPVSGRPPPEPPFPSPGLDPTDDLLPACTNEPAGAPGKSIGRRGLTGRADRQDGEELGTDVGRDCRRHRA